MAVHKNVVLAFGIAATGLSGCGELLKQAEEVANNEEVEFSENEKGDVTGKFDANSSVEQTLSASSDSSISGAKLTMAPGSLAIATEISVDEGGDIADSLAASELNLAGDNQISTAGPTVVVTSSDLIDTLQPFTLAVPISSDLGLTAACNVVVVFRVVKASEDGQFFVGLIPKTDLTISDTTVSFETSNFGAFQAACTTVEITEKQEVISSTPIVRKNYGTKLSGLWKSGCAMDTEGEPQDTGNQSPSPAGQSQTQPQQGQAAESTSYKREFLTFGERKFVFTGSLYEDEGCSGKPLVSFQFGGPYKIGADIASGGQEFDYTIAMGIVTAFDPDFVTEFSSRSECGVGSWTAGKPVQLDSGSVCFDDNQQEATADSGQDQVGSTTQPSTGNNSGGNGLKIGEAFYGAFKIEEGKLYLSDEDSSDSQDRTPESRATAFNELDFFVK